MAGLVGNTTHYAYPNLLRNTWQGSMTAGGIGGAAPQNGVIMPRRDIGFTPQVVSGITSTAMPSLINNGPLFKR